jgi:hypothetical protein
MVRLASFVLPDGGKHAVLYRDRTGVRIRTVKGREEIAAQHIDHNIESPMTRAIRTASVRESGE